MTGSTVVIWNRNAGSKAGLPTNAVSEDELRRVLAQHGLERDFFESASEAAAIERVDAAIAEGAAVVAAAGGDGTVRSVAFRLLELSRTGRDVPALGVLPLGSAMNIAMSIGLPLDLEGAASVLANGATRTIDVGLVNGRPFLEIASIGLSADAFGHAKEIDERRWGAVFQLLGLLLQNRRTRVRLRVDHREVRSRALALAIANGSRTGFRIELAPDAVLDDGRLDVVVFEGLSAWGLARHMAATLGGRDGRTERFRSYRGSQVRVDAHRPLAVYADGEDRGVTPVELSVLPRALRVVAPPD